MHKKLLNNTPTLLLFTEEKKDLDSQIKSWIRIQKTLNLLAKNNIESHIFCSATDMFKIKTKIFSKKEIMKINLIEKEFADLLQISPMTIQIVLRVGYAEPVSTRSLRKDVDSLLITKTSKDSLTYF